MDLNEAKALTVKYKNTAKTIHVSSDGSIYINGDLKAIEKHIKTNDLELFHVKPEKDETKKQKQ